MDIFDLHRQVMDDYKDFVRGFINIKDEQIRQKVDQELKSGRLWPEPLIQFNPAYRRGSTTEDLIEEGLLHEEIRKVFAGFRLFDHQVKALRRGCRGEDFIVTSGTGSGKSLTYQGTIFNHVFQHPGEQGVKAIIVYPMNALINSQLNELEKHKANYEKNGSDFPISFGRYTGQEGELERKRLQDNPPDIILTNYMMMELIMTRSKEKFLRSSFKDSLQFLVYDELHTYRGRQGADVAMQIRRLKSLTDRNLVCIGTSATMASGGSLQKQQEEVAKVGRQIFGKPFSPEQIIGEEFELTFPKLPEEEQILRAKLREAVERGIDTQASERELRRHVLGSWLESQIGLKETEGQYVRQKPFKLSEIVANLAELTGFDEYKCNKQIRRFLAWTQYINTTQKGSDRETWLPYKLHQFIKQSGSVHVTLKPPKERVPDDDIRLEAGFYTLSQEDGESKKIPIFPVVFSRISGHEMLCVRLDNQEEKIVPRNFDELALEEEDEWNPDNIGYIIFDHEKPVWQEDDKETLPDSWFTSHGNLRKEHQKKIPSRIYVDAEGNFSFKELAGRTPAWFVHAPLIVDPTCGVRYSNRTSENTKLTKLGSEARSTSTSVLSKSTIYGLHEQNQSKQARKVLSFTDVRQDASLQAGHFNDFTRTVQLRSGIYHALQSAPDQQLDHTQIATRVFENLGLDEAEYARNPESGGFQTTENKNERAFKKKLFYDIVYDLRLGWRVVMPNLEQCGLLRVDYNELETICEQEHVWKLIPGFNRLDRNHRKKLLYHILEYFRKQHALHHSEFDQQAIEPNEREIRNQLNPEWGLAGNERITFPNWMRLQTVRRTPRGVSTESIGPMSKLGRFLRSQIELKDLLHRKADYEEAMSVLLDNLEGSFIASQTIQDPEKGEVKLYRLELSTLIWQAIDREDIAYDPVNYQLEDPEHRQPVHRYFKDLYKEAARRSIYVRSSEHTGQINNEDRVDREQKFSDGDLSVLFCSPTMELGIDIADLNIVHMRNVPPNPANYAQRSGRAGRGGQPALIMTYCANSSPHDRHYFEHNTDMVAGEVLPPRLDITNEELAEAHFHAIYLAEVDCSQLNQSIADLLDLSHGDYPISDEIWPKFLLSNNQKDRVRHMFGRLFKDEAEPPDWYGESWIEQKLADAPYRFDRCLERWRELFRNANRQRERAQQVLDDPTLQASHDQKQAARRDENQARRQIDLLRNEASGSAFSEFYPFRYLASEGFLPGYNFTRLPVRAYMPAQASSREGDYLSRPRRTALREFAPRNVVYHNGAKYSVVRMNVADLDNKKLAAKVARKSGYLLQGKDLNKEVCPFTEVNLQGDDQREYFSNLLEMNETHTIPRQRISCDEEERASQGYVIDTFFQVDGSMDSVQNYRVTGEHNELLRLRFIPAAKLYFVNRKWRIADRDGFVLNTVTGEWSISQNMNANGNGSKADTEHHDIYRLYVTETADALYIHPSESLDVSYQGVVTLQYALKNAVEQVFQVEPNEIRVELMGEGDLPNIMMYEAAEGSLGVLRQLAEEPGKFKQVVERAWQICYFHLPEEEERSKDPASYDDLLSYYNQYHHKDIDRQEIKHALQILRDSTMEPEHHLEGGQVQDYQQHYEYLREHTDPDSELERKFLDYLYRHHLRLPEEAQKNITDIYVEPDFFYAPNVCIFLDGSVHDHPNVEERDEKQRRELMNMGYQVISISYMDKFDEIVAKRPDIFKKV